VSPAFRVDFLKKAIHNVHVWNLSLPGKVPIPFSLRIAEDPKPLKNPDLKRFSLVFSSPDGDVTIRGCLFHTRGKEVFPPSVMLGRRPYDVVKLSPELQAELARQFAKNSEPLPNRKEKTVRRLASQGYSLF
jgi:hypothetical protein